MQHQHVSELQSLGNATSVVLCRKDTEAFYRQFLDIPMPLESSLLNPGCGNALAAAQLLVPSGALSAFPDVLNAEISLGAVGIETSDLDLGLTLTQLRNWLHGTFFKRRARQNPSLYGIDCAAILMDLERMTAEEKSLYAHEFRLFSGGQKAIEDVSLATLADFFTILAIYDVLDK